jgi:hypothetical protein
MVPITALVARSPDPAGASRLTADELLVEQPSGDLEEFTNGGIAEIVVHDRALLAGDHDVLRPQDGERKAASSFFGGLTPSLPGNLSISRSAIG